MHHIQSRFKTHFQNHFNCVVFHLALLLVLLPQSVLARPAEFVPGEMLVKLKGKMSSVSAKTFLSKMTHEKGITLKGSFSSLNMHHFALKPGQSVVEAVREIESDPTVEYAEPNYILRKSQATPQQNQTQEMSSAPIQTQQAWTQINTASGDRPIVALIDTGVDIHHSALSNAIWVNAHEIPANGIDDDNNGFIDDVNGWNFMQNNNDLTDCEGHGTHVAGIIRGVGQDLFSVPAQEPLIQIMPLKFLGCDGSGNTADAVKAVYYAINNGARVINNSWGGAGYSRALLDALAYSYQAHALVVAAAGNEANDIDSLPEYPAAYDVPNILSVAATSDEDLMASFSNYGSHSVHMAAPGVSILSTFPNNQFSRLSGTSMAAPFVSGIAALMFRERPALTGYQTRQLILGAVDSISMLSQKVSSQGRLNAYSSVVAAKQATITSYQPTYVPGEAPLDRGTASVASKNGGCGLISKIEDDEVSLKDVLLILFILVPITLALEFRRRLQTHEEKRSAARVSVHETIHVRIEGREFVGTIHDLSLTGIRVEARSWIEKGSRVVLNVPALNGGAAVEITGEVKWSSAQKRYGIQFMNLNDTITAAVAAWMQVLQK